MLLKLHLLVSLLARCPSRKGHVLEAIRPTLGMNLESPENQMNSPKLRIMRLAKLT